MKTGKVADRSELQREQELAEIEEALKEINEVEAARIILGDNGSVEEVHVLALAGKGPKNLVRDIESTLIAKFGLAVDHKKISIAQMSGDSSLESDRDGSPDRSQGERARPQIVSVGLEARGSHTRVTVVLGSNGMEYRGAAEGPTTRTGRMRLVALATLEAVERFAGLPYTLALEDVALVPLGHQEVVVTCISMVKPEGEVGFSGSAIAGDKGNDTVVRATLDAINRRFGILKTT